MSDSQIGSLPRAASINDEDKFALEQNGEAKHLLGATLKGYAVQAAAGYAGAAQVAALQAEGSRQQAGQSATSASQSATAAGSSEANAQAAATAAQACTTGRVMLTDERDHAVYYLGFYISPDGCPSIKLTEA